MRLWLAAAALASLLVAGGLSSAADGKPNILHIHADDLRADGLAALGNPVLKTPNLDALVAQGFTFTHCYTMGSMVGAVCQPSRTMMLTGRSWLRIPNARMNQGDPAASLPTVMSRAGYETWHCGKGGNEYTVGLNAFDTNLRMDDRSAEERRGSCERHADAAIGFLKERKRERPFYMYVAPSVPHDPRTAAAEFHRMYEAAKIPLPAAFKPVHPFDNGEMTVRDEQLAPWPRTAEDTKQQLTDYYACVTGLDYHAGRIFAELKSSGQWDNTVVVFTSDNGLSIGEHGLFGKQNLYEFGGMHVPCVIAGPGINRGKSDAFVYLMDLFPTFAELGGGTLPEGVEGKSILPIVAGKQEKVRDVCYTAYRDSQRAVRDQRWKLMRYPLVDQTQLFDLQNDPHELVNLASKPEHQAKVAEMTKLLAAEMERHGDEAPLKVANPKPAAWTPPGKASGN
jgi:arylsulfatase A-like enzyme